MHSKFRQTSCIEMFLRVNKETFSCPVVFYEEIIVLFWMKISQIDTENDKISKFLTVNDFMHLPDFWRTL